MCTSETHSYLDGKSPAGMPERMRAQRKRVKEAKLKSDSCRKSREQAVELLRKRGTSIRGVADVTNIPKTTVGRISQCISKGDAAGLNRLLHPEVFHPGRKTVLSSVEEEMIAARIIFSAKRGFAFAESDLRTVMTKIASDGRRTWENGAPSDEAIRSFRARHTDISLKTHLRKDSAKFRAEDPAHLLSYKSALKEVEMIHPGIFADPSRFWNIDETAVLTEMGRTFLVRKIALIVALCPSKPGVVREGM